MRLLLLAMISKIKDSQWELVTLPRLFGKVQQSLDVESLENSLFAITAILLEIGKINLRKMYSKKDLQLNAKAKMHRPLVIHQLPKNLGNQKTKNPGQMKPRTGNPKMIEVRILIALVLTN